MKVANCLLWFCPSAAETTFWSGATPLAGPADCKFARVTGLGAPALAPGFDCAFCSPWPCSGGVLACGPTALHMSLWFGRSANTEPGGERVSGYACPLTIV